MRRLRSIATLTPNVRPFAPGKISAPPGISNGVLFIDYDGTLAPIVPTPAQARIPARIRQALLRAASHPRWIVSIVSGRKLEDVRRRVGLPNLVYAGNHGFEIKFPGQPLFVHPAAQVAMPLIGRIHDQLRRETAHLPGVIVENKRYTLSVHTRLAGTNDERRAHLALMHAARLAIRRREVVVRRGKKVLELRPAAPWDKGRAVEAIMGAVKPPVLAVYFGDDNTDEDAFRALTGGITVRVGKGETNAKYYIRTIAEMPRTLTEIVDLLPARRAGERRFSAGPMARAQPVRPAFERRTASGYEAIEPRSTGRGSFGRAR